LLVRLYRCAGGRVKSSRAAAFLLADAYESMILR